MGAFLLVSVLITLIWELIVKRAFVEELLSKAKISQEVQAAGLAGISPSFHDMDWSGFFKSCQKIDVVAAYARTWRNINHERLIRFCQTNGTRLRVILPDPDNVEVITQLAKRFGYEQQFMREIIEETIKFYHSLPQNGQVEIYLFAGTMIHTLYRFDNIIVFSPYIYRRERSQVPVWLARQGGFLFEFFIRDIHALVSGEHPVVRRWYPTGQKMENMT